MALYFTTHGLVMAAATAIVSRVISKVNVKAMLVIGEIILSLAFASMAFFNSVWHWYLISIVTGICCAAVQMLTPMLILNNWFVKKAGLATGLFFLANGLGGAVVFSPIINSLLLNVGWRQTYLIAGGLALIGPAVVLLLVKYMPADKGLLPYGVDDNVVEETNRAVYGPTEKEALKSGIVPLTIIAAAAITMMGSFQSMMSTYANYADMLAIAGTLLSCFNVGYAVANFLLPTLADKLRVMMTAAIGLVAGVLAAVCFLLAKGNGSTAIMLVGGVLFGVTTATTSLFNLMIREIYGTRDFAKLFSYHTITQTLVGSVTITIFSLVMENMGADAAMYLIIAVALVALVTLFIAIRASRKKFTMK